MVLNPLKKNLLQKKGGRRSHPFKWTAILTLLCLIFAQSREWELTSHSVLIKKEEALNEKPVDFQLKLLIYKTVYVSMYGYGYAQITYTDPRTMKEVIFTCRSPSHVLCPLWNYDIDENGWDERTKNGNVPPHNPETPNHGTIPN